VKSNSCVIWSTANLFRIDHKRSAVKIFQVGIRKYHFLNAKCVNGEGH